MRDDNLPTGGAMLPMRADQVHTRFLLDDGKGRSSASLSLLSVYYRFVLNLVIIIVCSLSFRPPDGLQGGNFGFEI